MIGINGNIKRKLGAALAGAAALCSVEIVSPPPATAQDFSNFIGGFLGGMMGGGYRPYGGYYGNGRRHHGGGAGARAGSGASTPPSQAESNNALAALAPPSTAEQLAVLKAVVPGNALGSVGASDDLRAHEHVGSGGRSRLYEKD